MALTKLEPYMVDTTATFTFANTTIANVTATNITGNVSNVPIAVNVSASSQPNITSVGTLTGLDIAGTLTYNAVVEPLVYKTGATGTVIHDYSTGDVWYHSSISASFTVNLTNTPTTTGRSITVTLILAQGGTPYIPNGFQINGTGYTINWPGGVTPSGRASKIDIATFIIVNPSGTFSVLGQYGSFG